MKISSLFDLGGGGGGGAGDVGEGGGGWKGRGWVYVDNYFP